MSDLPKGWIKTILFEIYDFSIGGDWGKDSKPNEKEYVEVKVVRGTDFKDWFRNKGRNAAQRFIKKSSLLKRNLKSGDIVVEVSGGGPTQPVGRSIIIDDSTLNIQKMPVVPSNFFRLLRLSSFVNPFFFNYYINFSNKIGLLDKYQTQTTNLRNLQYTDFLGNFEVPFPPLKEQKRIVEKLDKLLAKVEAAKERLDKIPGILKKYRQSVLHASVTGELTKEWREENNSNNQKSLELLNAIFIELKKNYPKKKFRKVNLESSFAPTKWTNSYMDNLFEVQTGATPLRKNIDYWKNGNIPWIKSGEVNNSDIKEASEFITELAIEETNVKLFPGETILVAMYGEGKTRGQVGILKIEATTNQACAALVNPNLNAISRRFVYLYCLSQYEDIRRKSSGGNQPNLNLSKIKDWVISLPPLEEQKEIVNRVEKLLSKADEIEARYKKAKEYLDKLSQSILAKAFRGELVPQDPNDPPASELLENIKNEKLAAKENLIKKRRASEPAEKLLKRIKAEKEAEEKKKKRPIKRHK